MTQGRATSTIATPSGMPRSARKDGRGERINRERMRRLPGLVSVPQRHGPCQDFAGLSLRAPRV
jgi:hypothetical protein